MTYFRAFLAITFCFVISVSFNHSSAQKIKQKLRSDYSSLRDYIVTEAELKTYKARSIGPAIMGGRVSDIAFDPNDNATFYVALGTGGLMKTTSMGAMVDPVFEKESVAAIGAVAVSPASSNHVWVGTGEANDRNSSSWGNGVYHSTDAGGSWTNTGLKNSKTIARIAPHPTDTNVVYVAAMGDLWNFGGERGLYKTTDAGKTWNLILSSKTSGDRVGCGDVIVDPNEPNIVYAALYARQRTPWSFTSGVELTGGNDEGGIFKSIDGGTTWKKLQNGLPARTQRIGLTMYRANTKTLYAIIQSDDGGTTNIDDVKSKKGGIFRTDDSGESWTRVNPLNPRPFYFSQIRVNPSNDKELFVLGFLVHYSDDGGKTFQEDHFSKVHPDCHAFTFDLKNPKHILLGTDGGIYQSFNSGKSWQHINNFAAGEFYRIAVDNKTPYRIAGGLQDNLNWLGVSATHSKDGIMNSDWFNIDGGDGFYCVFDPTDSNIVYAESQQGYVHRYNLKTGEVKGLRPEPTEGQMAYRFHWNSPLIGSVHQKDVLYLAGNRVFKLMEKGEQFTLISPDLSTQDRDKIITTGSGAEAYGVVYTLAESPLKQGMLWVGTDDGKFWVTEDDGISWKDLTPNLPKEIKGLWISRVEASHFDDKTAYLVADGHRTGNYKAYIYKTTDAGKTWESIVGNLSPDEPVKVVREDLKNPRLLFAGTEFNLFISMNSGETWMKFGDLPTVAVDDILIHPREKDLVIATHGRSLYIVDDIHALEDAVDTVLVKDAFMFTLKPASGSYQFSGFADWAGVSQFRGANPPDGATIDYYVKEFSGDGVSFSITNSAGQTVANLSGPGTPGFNRITWDLRISRDLLTDYGGEGQKFVKSGEYTVSMTYGKTNQKQTLQVHIADGIETR